MRKSNISSTREIWYNYCRKNKKKGDQSQEESCLASACALTTKN